MTTANIEMLDLGDVVAELMESQGEKWLKIATRVVGNPDGARDVLQEAVRRVLLRNRPFQTRDEIRMYLARTISNTAIELYHIRRRERKRQLPLKDYIVPAPESNESQDSLERKEHIEAEERLMELLRQGLARLPVKQYEAVYLTVMEPGLSSIREAGIERGIPYSTLRHRSIQGLSRLRKFIEKGLRAVPSKVVLA